VTINLLKQRIQTPREIARDQRGGNLPDADAVYEVLIAARKELDQNGRLAKAVEARVVFDALGDH
jgi:hypothetical protein